MLSVPESAVIDTGDRKIVYVETEPGVFEGREVVLGPRIGDRFPVLEGLVARREGGGRRRLPDRRREPDQPGTAGRRPTRPARTRRRRSVPRPIDPPRRGRRRTTRSIHRH